ncbi:MAG: hypothetical protein ACYDHH_19575 [Solirubrobacteraceae bacterium]
MRLAIAHRYDFGAAAALAGADLADVRAWDALRIESDGAFALPESRAAWLALAGDGLVRARAEAVDAVLRSRGVASFASYGAGTAVTELCLGRLDPRRRTVVTELAPATAERLRLLFTEAQVLRHDLRNDPPVAGVDLHLLFRVDTELSDDDWTRLLARFRRVPLLVAATELLTPRAVLRELRTLLKPHATRAGLVRSRGAFEALFRPTHEPQRVRLHDLQGWLLEPR